MIDQNYNNILEEVLKKGSWYDDPNRKDVKRLEIPSYTFRHEFKDGFPAISTKKLAWRSVVTELIWFLQGNTNIKYLVDNGCNIWNKDAYNYFTNKCREINILEYSFDQFIENIKNNKEGSIHRRDYNLGDLGKVYGHYWRNFNGIDQIKDLIHDMINKPMSSELLVVARDPSHKGQQALPCCHYGFQVIMRPLSFTERDNIANPIIGNDINYPEDWDALGIPKYGFELHWNQRSCDLFLGIPFNIASYALLALILEKITGHKALGIQGDWKKVHLYDNSIKAAEEQLTRKPSEERVLLQGYPITEGFDEFNLIHEPVPFTVDKMVEILDEIKDDIVLINYNPQPAIKVEMLERR